VGRSGNQSGSTLGASVFVSCSGGRTLHRAALSAHLPRVAPCACSSARLALELNTYKDNRREQGEVSIAPQFKSDGINVRNESRLLGQEKEDLAHSYLLVRVSGRE
jgi:hypothetical protein